MNCNLPSVLLITLLNWGLMASAVKFTQQFPLQIWRCSVAHEALSTMPAAAERYVPPNCGLPTRREGGESARWRQDRLSTQVAPQRSLMGDNIRFSYDILT